MPNSRQHEQQSHEQSRPRQQQQVRSQVARCTCQTWKVFFERKSHIFTKRRPHHALTVHTWLKEGPHMANVTLSTSIRFASRLMWHPHSALSRCPRAALVLPSRRPWRPHSTKLGFARSCGQFTWHCEHRGRTHSMPCSALGARLNSRWQRIPELIPASQVVGRSSSCCRAYAHFFMMRRNSNS